MTKNLSRKNFLALHLLHLSNEETIVPIRLFIGMNGLLLYVGHMVCYQNFPFHWSIGNMDNRALRLCEAIWGPGLWTIIAYIMHRKRIYITLWYIYIPYFIILLDQVNFVNDISKENYFSFFYVFILTLKKDCIKDRQTDSKWRLI